MGRLSQRAKGREKGGQPLYPLLGFFPLVISLEFKRNSYPEMPEPTVLSLLWR
uniref:Translocase of outer membrane 7 kDa subunit homolog n=1 Tax=Ursus maritimus TaxID=29073 RepID=A0A452TDN7_URSMA